MKTFLLIVIWAMSLLIVGGVSWVKGFRKGQGLDK